VYAITYRGHGQTQITDYDRALRERPVVTHGESSTKRWPNDGGYTIGRRPLNHEPDHTWLGAVGTINGCGSRVGRRFFVRRRMFNRKAQYTR